MRKLSGYSGVIPRAMTTAVLHKPRNPSVAVTCEHMISCSALSNIPTATTYWKIQKPACCLQQWSQLVVAVW